MVAKVVGKLFEPVNIGKMELKNRIVMPSMATNFFAMDGTATRRSIAFYEERAKGGVGLIVTSSASPVPQMKLSGQMGIWDFRHVPALSDLTYAVHMAGAKIAVQLEHAGRQNVGFIDGVQPVAPSPIPSSLIQALGGMAPRELTTNEVEAVEDAFAAAALRTKFAGFDAVEVHCAHGYLLSEFLSPLSNKRTDQYGGDLNGRVRIVVNIIGKIKAKLGRDYPVICRINGSDYLSGGLTVAESQRIAQRLEEAGADAISVSAGMYESVEWVIQPLYLPYGCLTDLAAEVKKGVNIPVITAGRINDPRFAEKVLLDGKADLVAMGRALLADPEMPNKALRGNFEDIRKCTGCMECANRVLSFATAVCSVNPEMGHEEEFRIRPAPKRKKVLVVGGGPGGLEAARVAALRGHSVVLCEKTRALGGLVRAGSTPAFKEDLRSLIEWYSSQLKKLKVKVLLNTTTTPAFVKKRKPDALIIAVGSSPMPPRVPGVDKRHVVAAPDALLGKTPKAQTVVVVGGGSTGCEIAVHFAGENKVKLVEMLPDIAND
ncbi:MAG: NADH:flavin oxidoreductase, partial [Candidatus Bathyarchaeia archaeon]